MGFFFSNPDNNTMTVANDKNHLTPFESKVNVRIRRDFDTTLEQ